MSRLDFIIPWTVAAFLIIAGTLHGIYDTGHHLLPLLGGIGWTLHARTQYRSYRIEHT